MKLVVQLGIERAGSSTRPLLIMIYLYISVFQSIFICGVPPYSKLITQSAAGRGARMEQETPTQACIGNEGLDGARQHTIFSLI